MEIHGIPKLPLKNEVLVALEPRDVTILMTGLATALRGELTKEVPLVTHPSVNSSSEPVTATELGVLLNQFSCSDLPTA